MAEFAVLPHKSFIGPALQGRIHIIASAEKSRKTSCMFRLVSLFQTENKLARLPYG